MKRTFTKTILALIVVFALGIAVYRYSRSVQIPSPVQIKGPEAAQIESTHLREFAADTDAPYTSVGEKDKAIYQEIAEDLKISGDAKDQSKINRHSSIDENP